MDAAAINFVFDADSSYSSSTTEVANGYVARPRQTGRTEGLQTLARLASAINANRPLIDILRIVRDGIIETGRFDRGAVFLYDRMRSQMVGTWGTDRNGDPIDISHTHYPINSNDPMPSMQILRGEIDYYLTHDYAGTWAIGSNDPMAEVRSHAIVPIQTGDRVIGMLCVDNLLCNRPISASDLETLIPLADQAAIAIRNDDQREEVRSSQLALLHSEKMRAVGIMASGIAHNVRNKLGTILGYAEMIQDCQGVTGEISHFARIIELATMDANQITDRVQSFIETDKEAIQRPFDMALIVQHAIDLTRPTWQNIALARGVKIEIVRDLTPNLFVLGFESEIREVLVNLIKNACEAMPDGGTLTLRCCPASQTSARPKAVPPGWAEDEMLLFTLSDTGMGMDTTTCERIFEPFFTTKGGKQGMGMGLAVAWGIIDRHSGQIDVQSTPGTGTTFALHLPLYRGSLSKPAENIPPVSLNGRTILLVEDQEIVVTWLARTLTRHGATVHFVQNCLEAQEWLETNAAICDLVMTDQCMIGLTGLQLLADIRAQYPALRRVLISAWTTNLPPNQDTTAAQLILPKPIRQRHLIAALYQLLNTTPENQEMKEEMK